MTASSVEELDVQISAMMRKSQTETGTYWECLACGQTSRYTIDIMRHVEAKLWLFRASRVASATNFGKQEGRSIHITAPMLSDF